jgi:hypothetical protein
MSALRIVHITPTPLVGAPGKIAWAQRMKGHDALAVALSDYPKGGPLEKMFLDRTILIDDFTRHHIEDCIRQADIIHVHNFLPDDRIRWLQELNQAAAYVYQAHSPKREGPLYVDRSEGNNKFEFKLKLVVGQHHGRFYPFHTPVPNLILSPPSIRRRQPGETLRVLFSPTQKQAGRWNSKYSPALEPALRALETIGKIEVIFPKNPLRPEVLMELRRSCHVSIDEIASGGFHMVSLEAMCAGSVAINRADYFAKATFAGFCDGEMPPFLYADDSCITDVLLRLADDWEETARRQQASFDFFQRYCNPIRLVEVFDAAYQSVR